MERENEFRQDYPVNWKTGTTASNGKGNVWVCPNDGCKNTANFCGECGRPRPGMQTRQPGAELPAKNTKVLPMLAALIAAVVMLGVLVAVLVINGNRLPGYYVSQSGIYSLSLEKDGSCTWYQNGLRFEGEYEELEDETLHLELKGASHYADTTFQAVREKEGLRVNGGTVKNELFTREKKPAEIKELDKAARAEPEIPEKQASDTVPQTPGQENLDLTDDKVRQIATGSYHAVILYNNGWVKASGENNYGQTDLVQWQDIIQVEVGNFFTMALTVDHRAIAAGSIHGLGWENIRKIAAGDDLAVGLRYDGTVVAEGISEVEEAVTGWKDIVDIAAGDDYLLGLKSDGTVVAAGDNRNGVCNVQDWKNIEKITAGRYHAVGLKSDGTVVAAGKNDDGQCDLSAWQDITQIGVGNFYTVGVRADGTAVAAGPAYVCQYVSEETDVQSCSAGEWHILMLREDGTVGIHGVSYLETEPENTWRNVVKVAAGDEYSIGITETGEILTNARLENAAKAIRAWGDYTAPTEPETQPKSEGQYLDKVDGYWEPYTLVDGNNTMNGNAFVFYEALKNCTDFTLVMNVKMQGGARCENWVLWGRINGKFQKIDTLYLPEGDGITLQFVEFDAPADLEAVMVSPTVSGDYSWELFLAVQDVILAD